MSHSEMRVWNVRLVCVLGGVGVYVENVWGWVVMSIDSRVMGLGSDTHR